MNRPDTSEYAPFYRNYIALVSDEPVLDIIAEQVDSGYAYFNGLTDEQASHAYGPDKWTIKQVLGHMIDAERTFAYRILAFSRGQEELPGFDENRYVELSTFNSRTIQNLAEEFKLTRLSNLYMLRALSPEQEIATGIANGSKIAVNTIVYILAGHYIHHLNIIKERYVVLR